MAIPAQRSSIAKNSIKDIDETDITTFNNELPYLSRHFPKQNVVIIDGDMNIQIGKNKNNEFRLHNQQKRNGEYLTDFSIKNSLSWLLGITHLFPHNELVHLPYIPVATNTRADKKVKSSIL